MDRRLLRGETIPQEEKVFFEEYTRWIQKGKASVPEGFALCHFLPARRPVGTPESLRPPVGRPARVVQALSLRNKGRISMRRCAANPGRAGPRPERRQPVSGGAAGRPQRSVAQPDRANQRPPRRSARRQPSAVATTVTRPSRRCICRMPVVLLHAVGVVDPAIDSLQGGAAVPASRRGCPKGSA